MPIDGECVRLRRPGKSGLITVTRAVGQRAREWAFTVSRFTIGKTSVLVLVVQIGHVRMIVDHSLMAMPMRVLAFGHWIVHVIVMSVIVSMRVLVLDRVVDVLVTMLFGEVKDEATHHEERADRGDRSGWLTHRPRERCPPERA
jgi:hypothetical protein